MENQKGQKGQKREKRERKRLTLEQMQEIARKLTHDTLLEYEVPEGAFDGAALGGFIEGRHRVFQLYLPAERPQDGRILTSARVCMDDGGATIEVFGLQRKGVSAPQPGSEVTQRWIEAGKLLAVDRGAQVSCPACELAMLEARDTPTSPGTGGVERYLSCPRCGTHNVILLRC